MSNIVPPDPEKLKALYEIVLGTPVRLETHADELFKDPVFRAALQWNQKSDNG